MWADIKALQSSRNAFRNLLLLNEGSFIHVLQSSASLGCPQAMAGGDGFLFDFFILFSTYSICFP